MEETREEVRYPESLATYLAYYKQMKWRETIKCEVILGLSLISYIIVTAYSATHETGILTIFFLLFMMTALAIRHWILCDRIKSGYYGTNRFEAEKIIESIMEDAEAQKKKAKKKQAT